MDARALELEFAALSIADGPMLVLDEHVALELIARAREEDVAVTGVDLVRRSDPFRPRGREARLLSHDRRLSSWNDAQDLVEMLRGRGLHFHVALESRWSTRLARLRAVIRAAVRDRTAFPS